MKNKKEPFANSLLLAIQIWLTSVVFGPLSTIVIGANLSQNLNWETYLSIVLVSAIGSLPFMLLYALMIHYIKKSPFSQISKKLAIVVLSAISSFLSIVISFLVIFGNLDIDLFSPLVISYSLTTIVAAIIWISVDHQLSFKPINNETIPTIESINQ